MKNYAPPDEETHMLRLELQSKVAELQKLRAVSEQQSFFLNQQLEEVKAREANIRAMNETIMQVLQDITNSNSKISTELQLKQFLEDHIRGIGANKANVSVLEEELRKARLELDKLRSTLDEKTEEHIREKETLNNRIMSLENERSHLLVELQAARQSNKGIYEKLRAEYEREINKVRGEMEELQLKNGERGSLELMKSQIKELTTQHLIETNSLKTSLNEARNKLERVYEAFCELKEKNAQMKTIIQSFRNKEARLKDLLFDRQQTETEDEDFGLGFDISYSNSMGMRPKAVTQKGRLEYSSITNILDAFASQEFLRVSPETGQVRESRDRSPKTDRFEQREQVKTTCVEFIKKRSLSQQLELKPEEFSKPFELERGRVKEEDSGQKNRDQNDSMEEFRNKRENGVGEYSDFMNRKKNSSKTMI